MTQQDELVCGCGHIKRTHIKGEYGCKGIKGEWGVPCGCRVFIERADKPLEEQIAKIIKAETEGGYLEYWDEYRQLLSKEQQDDYFKILAGLILDLKLMQKKPKKQIGKERHETVFGGWHFCWGTVKESHKQEIVKNGKLCPICGRG